MPNTLTDVAELQGTERDAWYRRRAEQVDAERGGAARQASTPAAARYGQLSAPPAASIEDLRRQQEAFAAERERLATRGVAWALPAVAPIVAVAGLEAGAALAVALAPKAAARAPLILTERMPYVRVGDNWATRAGRRAHKYYQEMAEAKPGWTSEPRIVSNGRLLKPDVRIPERLSSAGRVKYVEVKPDTPTGRAAGARQVEKYKAATGERVRVLYYDPKRFM